MHLWCSHIEIMEHPHFDNFRKFIHFFKKWCTFNVLRKRSCNVHLSTVLYNFNIFPKKRGNAVYLVYNTRINTTVFCITLKLF